MVSNDVVKNTFADLIEDFGYPITFDDIDGKARNKIGIYLRDAGNPVLTLSNKIVKVTKDLNIRLHGDTTTGSQKACEEIMAEIADRLVFSNKRFNGFKVLSSTLRKAGERIGTTTNGIPVYQMAFLVTYQEI